MTHRLLFALFFVLFAAGPLGFDFGLAPGVSLKNLSLYVVFATLAIELAITRRGKLDLLPVVVPYFLYVLYAMFTLLVIVLVLDYQRYSAMQAVMSLKAGPAEHLLVLLMFFYGTSDSERALWVLRRMLWVIVIFNVLGVLDALGFFPTGLAKESKERFAGTFGNSNEFAYFLALFLPAIVALYWNEKGLKRKLAAAGAVVSGLAFLMTLSRGGIVGLIVGGILAAWYLRSVIPAQVMFRAGFGAMVLCAVILAGTFATDYGDRLVERLTQMGGNPYDASSGRTAIWGQALNSMLEHPVTFITGFGWNSYNSDIQFRHATHNTYLDILYNLGMVGIGLFVLTAANALRAVRAGVSRADPESRPFLIAFVFGFAAVLICIVFGGIYTSWLYLWAFVGISLRLAVSQMNDAPIGLKTAVGQDTTTAVGDSSAAPLVR